MKRILATVLVGAAALTTAGCFDSDAYVVGENISTAAEQFEINRRVVFLNVRSGKYELLVEGKCNINDDGNQLEVLCKTAGDEYKKHFLGKAGDMTYFVEQLDAANADRYQYRVIFKPEAIVPDFDRP